MSFSANQKVVCVDGKFSDEVRRIYTMLPEENKVYVIRETRAGVNADILLMDMRRQLEQSLTLVGIINPANNLGVEAGFSSKRFRALEEIKLKQTKLESNLIAA